MNELPPGWAKITLGGAGPLVGGKTPSKSSSAYWDHGTVPWISPKDMKAFEVLKSEDMITPRAVNEAGMEVLPVDSVLMVTRSGILERTFPVAITAMETSINQDIKALRPSRQILPRYAAYALRSFGQEILTQCSKAGTTVASVNTEALEKFPLPLAPRDEQKRITAKLDAVLANVDMCRTRLDRVPQILKKFREAVLEAAVSGRLTEDWRALHTTSEKWPTYTVGELAAKVTDGEHITPKRVQSGKYLLSARNVQDGYITLQDVDHVDDEEFLRIRRRCDPSIGDVLLSCSGSVGRAALVDRDNYYVMVRSAAMIRPIAARLLSKYLMYSFQSPPLQVQIKAKSSATAQSNIFLGAIRSLTLSLPTIPEQREIVRRVDELFVLGNSLENRHSDTVARVQKLTPSVLDKAFRGELVPQDPNDEPAGEMLERMRMEKGNGMASDRSQGDTIERRTSRHAKIPGGRRARQSSI